MKHLELLNDDVEYFSTYNLTPCCNSCNDGGGGGCGCDTYVCVGDVCAVCDSAANVCDHCNIASDDCGYLNL